MAKGGLTFDVDRNDISLHIDASVRQGMGRPISRAMNRSMSRTMTQAKREIAEARNLRVGYVGKELRVKRATTRSLEAHIFARGKSIPLTALATKPVQLKAGVRAKVEKRGSPHLFKGAFLAKMPNGKVGVFERKGKTARRRPKRKGKGGVYRTDLPIKEIRLPSIPSTLVNDDVISRLRPFTFAEFEKELLRQLDLQAKGV